MSKKITPMDKVLKDLFALYVSGSAISAKLKRDLLHDGEKASPAKKRRVTKISQALSACKDSMDFICKSHSLIRYDGNNIAFYFGEFLEFHLKFRRFSQLMSECLSRSDDLFDKINTVPSRARLKDALSSFKDLPLASEHFGIKSEDDVVIKIIGSWQFESPEPIDTYLQTAEASVKNRFYDIFQINPNRIDRSISFPPELHRAGMTILSYFSNILKSKYPNEEVAVTIEQRDPYVTLIIDPPDGQREVIEQCLHDYMLVVKEERLPESFLDTKIEVLELKNMLRIARLEVEQKQEIISLKQEQIDGMRRRIDNIEEYSKRQFTDMVSLISASVASSGKNSENLIDIIRIISLAENNKIRDCVEKIIQTAEETDNSLEENAEVIKRLLMEVRAESPIFVEKIKDIISNGVVGGVAGNAAYSALVSFIQSLPKI